MKKLLVMCICLFAAVSAKAAWQDDVKDAFLHSGADGIKAFAQDIGSMTGMMDFRSGTADRIGAGLAANVLQTSDKNILNSYADVDYIGMGYVYGDVKVPLLGLALGARGTAIEGYESLGAGLKYSIAGESIIPFFPDITASFYYDRINFDYFDGYHLSASVAASVKVLILEPYVGVGYDRTHLDIKNIDPAVNGYDTTGEGVRYTGGLNVTVLPFMKVFASVSGTKDTWGASAGVGARF